MNQHNFSADNFLSQSLQKREAQNTLRRLVVNDNMVDLCSNDYLGFARSKKLHALIKKKYAGLKHSTNGAGGSRLLSGNTEYAEKLEKKIAKFHNADAGLIYNSGYDANVGLFSSVLQKTDTIIYDELIHASIHDGIKLSQAKAFLFRHNDLQHLEDRLKIAEGIIYVAVESIYSMDGDEAPLKEILTLCEKYNANLIVDEAHATGVTKNKGKGKVQELKLEKRVFARIHTFGKALGCHGAIILGSELLRNYLINYSRSFIYTTALPLKSLVAIEQAYELLVKSEEEIKQLHRLIAYFKDKSKGLKLIPSNSPIQCVVISGNDNVKKAAAQLQQKGLDARPILSPTVPKTKERIRICLHAYNTPKQIDLTVEELVRFFSK